MTVNVHDIYPVLVGYLTILSTFQCGTTEMLDIVDSHNNTICKLKVTTDGKSKLIVSVLDKFSSELNKIAWSPQKFCDFAFETELMINDIKDGGW